MKRKIAQLYIRFGRGEALLSIVIELVKVTVYFGALSLLFEHWFGFILPNWFVGFIVGGYTVVCVILGYLDEKFGIWKLQNDLITKELTPYFKELDEKIDQLLKKLPHK